MNKILNESTKYQVLITLACLICFYNSLENDFVHDDIFAIKNNKDVRSETPIWNIFANDFWGRNLVDPKSHKSYRPLCTLTFRINYALFGMDPFWFHLINLILHISVCNILFCVLCTSICIDTSSAFLTVMLFATHPIHVEAVSMLLIINFLIINFQFPIDRKLMLIFFVCLFSICCQRY